MRRVAPFMRRHGIDMHEISAQEAQALFPIGDLSDVLSAFYIPEDGRANPVDVTMSLAKGARMGGARIFEGKRVAEILAKNGTATGVRLESGETVTAENVVICGGMWSRQLGAKAGINLPLQAAEHYYLITETIDGLSRDLPVLEDPTTYTYFREEVGGLMLGLFEPVGAAWHLDAIPADFAFGEIDPDWDRMLPHLEKGDIIIDGGNSYFPDTIRRTYYLAEKGINIQVITTSEIKVSVLISEEYTELALRALHTAYGLDAD